MPFMTPEQVPDFYLCLYERNGNLMNLGKIQQLKEELYCLIRDILFGGQNPTKWST